VGKLRHAVRSAEGADERDKEPDGHNVAGLDRDREGKDVNLPVAVQDSEGNQQSVDSARSANGGRAPDASMMAKSWTGICR